MIRKRIPAVDDKTIYQLVLRQLLPYSRVANPQARTNYTSIERRLNENEATFVETHGRSAPLGFVTVKCKNRKLYIDMLAIDERYQGRGLGSALMRAAEQYGVGRGCTEAFLFVDESNPRAQTFYMGKGYELVDYDSSFRCFRMSKTLR